MSLILKSNQIFLGSLMPAIDAYKARVIADGGLIKNETMMLDAFLFMREEGLNAANIFSATSANWGIKVSGNNVVKLYNLFDAAGDVVIKKGSYALQGSGGKFSFFSAGSESNAFEAEGIIVSPNQSMFHAFVRGTTPVASRALSETYTADGSYRGLNVFFNAINNTYESNGYDVSGQLVGISYDNDVGVSITPDGMKSYRNGQLVYEDNTVTYQPQVGFKYYLAAPNQVGNAKLAGVEGNFYASIVAVNLTYEQNLALSRFVGRFI